MPVDVAAASRLQPGQLFGDYRVERLLGRGGMGAVYEATHVNDGRVVALKLLSVDLDQMDARQRFLREGQTAAAINHPNAVYIYGTEEIDGTPVIVMELVDGGTLEDKVKRDGPLDVQDAVEKVLQIIDGLDAALAVGVLHRDVKPSNCFVTADGNAKIGDFGLSKPVDSIEQHKLTQTGLFLGTPVYSSPEQLLGEDLDERSDIYAVGVTFYYLLTGRLPYESGSLMQVMAAVLNGTPAPMTGTKQTIPLPVQQVVLKALARHAKDRYQTYDEFREAVAALRAPEVRPATLWERLLAWLMDSIPIGYVMSGGVLVYYSTKGIVMNPQEMNRNWLVPFVTFIAMMFVVALPEGLRGAALGKWLIGIRVTGEDGNPIGFARSVARLALLSLSSAAIVLTYLLAPVALQGTLAVVAYVLFSLVLPLSTARPSNGWRMLQDVLTKSYVVRPIPRPRQRRSDVDSGRVPTLAGNEQELAQYVVLGDVPAHPGVVAGWDRSMQRRVWIAQPFSESELPAERRAVSRLTRLRWTASVRQDDARWDVFEAPSGEPFEERMKRPVLWITMRNWLTDMLAEARASEADGSWPVGASISQLWVTASDEIVLTDALPQHAPASSTTPAAFIAELARRLQETPVGSPRPVYASRALQSLTTASTLNEIEIKLRETFSKPVEVTRRRRIGPMLIISAFCLVIGFFSRSVFVQLGGIDREGSLAQQLVKFNNDRRACSIEYTESSRLNRCTFAPATPDSSRSAFQKFRDATGEAWTGIGLPALLAAADGPPKSDSVAAEEKRLARIYVATQLAGRVRDTITQRPQDALSDTGRVQALAYIAAHSDASADDVAKARYLVDTLWQGKTVHHIEEQSAFISLATVIGLAMFMASLALVSSLVARRGALLRAFQIDFVTNDGKPARRWRLIARTLLTWSIFAVPFVGMLLVSITPTSVHPAMVGVLFVAIVAAWIYGLVSVIRTPLRGLPERITRTHVVIE